MITRFKIYRREVKLAELFALACKRRDKPYRDFYDYLTTPEQLEFSRLASEHYELCKKLGEESGWFSPKRDAMRNDPNSPIGTISVQEKTGHRVTFAHDENGDLWKYVDGERVGTHPIKGFDIKD